jgi:hypothetical protein
LWFDVSLLMTFRDRGLWCLMTQSCLLGTGQQRPQQSCLLGTGQQRPQQSYLLGTGQQRPQQSCLLETWPTTTVTL